MDRKALLALIDEAKRAEVADWLDSDADAIRDAAKNAAGYDRRKMDKTIESLVKERDTLTSEVEHLKASTADASGVASKVKELERQLQDTMAERDKLLPVVLKHREGVLRQTVIETAKLADDLFADALVHKFGITLTDGDTLSEEHTKALSDWAADPANKGRVKGENQTPTVAPGFPVAPAWGGNGAANLSDPLKAWASRLSPTERAVIEKTGQSS